MIYPAPEGVTPLTHKCGCGGIFTMPYIPGRTENTLVCREDPEHNTYVSNYKSTRMVTGVELNMKSGQPENAGSLEIIDNTTALARVDKAHGMGMFPESRKHPWNEKQRQALAIVALAYGLDPFMQEIIPYQGKPYITIVGRRRLDARAGNHGELRFRPLNVEEKEEWTSLGALAPKDVAGYCCLRDVDTGASVEAFARVLESERSKDQMGADHLPTVQRVLEMYHKRGEMRARQMLWGPVGLPDSLKNTGIKVNELEDGMFEGEVVESTSRAIEDRPSDEDQLPSFGDCPIHPESEWITAKDKYGSGLNVFHFLAEGSDEPYCRLSVVLKTQFGDLWSRSHNGTKVQGELNSWLKETYNGLTWSKMSPQQWYDAIERMGKQSGVDIETGAIDDSANPEPEVIDTEYQEWLAQKAAEEEMAEATV